MSLLEQIHSLAPGDSRLLHQHNIDEHVLQVREYENIRWINSGGTAVQSLLDTGNPSALLLPNHIAMLAGFFFLQDSRRILNLGMGGGCFERFFLDNFPEWEVTSVEPDTSIIEIARKYFYLPDQLTVINKTAESFLDTTTGSFNIILCDIFEGENHPDCLFSDDFYHTAEARLQDQGVMVLNILPETQTELVNMLLPLRRAFATAYLLEVRNHGNIILIASNREPPTAITLAGSARLLSRQSGIDLLPLAGDLQRLPPVRNG